MNAKKVQELKLKAKRYAEQNDFNEAQEKRAYQVLKQIYKESSEKERKEMGL